LVRCMKRLKTSSRGLGKAISKKSTRALKFTDFEKSSALGLHLWSWSWISNQAHDNVLQTHIIWAFSSFILRRYKDLLFCRNFNDWIHGGISNLTLISPTHKRTEGRAPVWGSDLLQKSLHYRGIRKNLLPGRTYNYGFFL
jgi:hypothetical protein